MLELELLKRDFSLLHLHKSFISAHGLGDLEILWMKARQADDAMHLSKSLQMLRLRQNPAFFSFDPQFGHEV